MLLVSALSDEAFKPVPECLITAAQDCQGSMQVVRRQHSTGFAEMQEGCLQVQLLLTCNNPQILFLALFLHYLPKEQAAVPA